MNSASLPRDRKLWLYVILPAVILNIGALVVYTGYYGMKYARPDSLPSVPENRLSLITYGMIFIVEWLFALGVIAWLRRNHWKERDLIPVMVAHWLLDAWGFGIFVLGWF